MSHEKSFTNKENKALLWNLMYECGVFKGIESKYLQNVQRDFEQKIIQITSSTSSTNTLTQLNKQIISEMMLDLNKYRNLAHTDKESLKQISIGKNIEPVTSQEVSDRKIQHFNNNLEKKQNEFDDLLKKKQPDEIDFSDDLDKPIGGEINTMLEAALSKRENELNIVLDKQNTKVAEEWINKDNDDKEKTVRFNETPKKEPGDQFLSKLKTIPKSDDLMEFQTNDILNIKNEIKKTNLKLEVIETLQREILELLRT